MAGGTMIRLPEIPVPGKPLGRHLYHDPGNRDWPVEPLLARARTERARVRPWWARPIFDQQGSSCTMQAACGLLVSVPFRRLPTVKAARGDWDTEEERHAGYLAAQSHDPWPGGEPAYEGSSTDAPFRLLRARGVIQGWRWSFTFPDALDTVRYVGPVAVGTAWKTGMDNPDSKNRIHFTGDDRGGHAWVWEYIDENDREIVAVNSWGKGYGQRGRVRVPFAEAEKMLAAGGEVCTIIPG